ncbi:MAG TPA: nicotinate-nucleotide adenylyltransferase [Rhizomicrobium sp.]|jgi:nicotinate-nucleotide adenylyltransferase|nr:nicotinate-nucleotide adenylyltransferase [Rhizomicrobium sp.]
MGVGWIKPPGPVASGLRVGLLGGSFNPAHEGHLHVSDIALKRLGLDYVWWLVSPQNPLKPARGMAPLWDRLAQARLLTRHAPRICVTGIETCLNTRYTIDTVVQLGRRFSQLRFVWLMGSDNLVTFHRWRKWQELAQRIPIAVVMRPGTTLAALKAKAARRFPVRIRSERRLADIRPPVLVILDARRSPASATAIRTRALGRHACGMLE